MCAPIACAFHAPGSRSWPTENSLAPRAILPAVRSPLVPFLASNVARLVGVMLAGLLPACLANQSTATWDEITAGFRHPVGRARIRVLDAIPRGGWDLDNLLR